MKKVIKLTEDDLARIVKRVLNEQVNRPSTPTSNPNRPSTTPTSSRVNRPSTTPTSSSSTTFVGKTVNLYRDINGKGDERLVRQTKITTEPTVYGSVGQVAFSTLTGNVRFKVSYSCLTPNDLEISGDGSTKVEKLRNFPLTRALYSKFCTKGAVGRDVPKADFASNNQPPNSDFA